VLPRRGKHPQMIFAYLKIAEKISHVEAFPRPDLHSKRMGNKMPNGNIIVDAAGGYNRFDCGAHKHMFERIKRHYVVGSESESRMLSAQEIRRLAPQFSEILSSVLGVQGHRAIDLISRKGRVLTAKQVKSMLKWLNSR
jgi:hypothetical protein